MENKYETRIKIAKANAFHDEIVYIIKDILEDDKRTKKQKYEEFKSLMIQATICEEKFN